MGVAGQLKWDQVGATPTCQGVKRTTVHPSGGQNPARRDRTDNHMPGRGTVLEYSEEEEGKINPGRWVLKAADVELEIGGKAWRGGVGKLKETHPTAGRSENRLGSGLRRHPGDGPFFCLLPFKVTQYTLSVLPLPCSLSDVWKHCTKLKELLQPWQSWQMPPRFTSWPVAMS